MAYKFKDGKLVEIVAAPANGKRGDSQIAALTKTLKEKESEIENLKKAEGEKDSQIAALTKTLKDLEAEVKKLKG